MNMDHSAKNGSVARCHPRLTKTRCPLTISPPILGFQIFALPKWEAKSVHGYCPIAIVRSYSIFFCPNTFISWSYLGTFFPFKDHLFLSQKRFWPLSYFLAVYHIILTAKSTPKNSISYQNQIYLYFGLPGRRVCKFSRLFRLHFPLRACGVLGLWPPPSPYYWWG